MKVNLVAFGKLKTPGLREAADYYKRLIRPWVPIKEIEFKSLPVPDKVAETRRQIQEKEGEMLLERIQHEISGRGILVLLDERGKSQTTQAWADQVRSWEGESIPSVTFCIGSSLGFSGAVRDRAKLSLSLGLQTLPHELARVVLLEQLYRTWSVIRGHPYHNEGG